MTAPPVQMKWIPSSRCLEQWLMQSARQLPAVFGTCMNGTDALVHVSTEHRIVSECSLPPRCPQYTQSSSLGKRVSPGTHSDSLGLNIG